VRTPGRQAAADFPALAARVHGRPLVYLDNAATTQVPRAVMERMTRFVGKGRANVHRGVHALAEQASAAYEGARATARAFLGARHAHEVIFVRGATEAINLVARTFGQAHVRPGDEVLVTGLEHHSNIVPWQMLCEQTGAHLRAAPITDEGELDLDGFSRLLSPRTRLVAVTHVSNAIGTITPVRAIVDLAHAAGATVLVDGAQAAAHLPIDVRALGCDFYALSGHKCYGPTGIGLLYGRAELLDEMPPFMGGGDMVSSVSFERTSYAPVPRRFEAGTPNLEGAVGLAAAFEYLAKFDRTALYAHEQDLLTYATEQLSGLPGLRLIGRARHKTPIVAFVLAGVHAHDVGTIVDRQGVALRTGHHCAQPLHDRFGLPATARASLALYNTRADVDALVRALDSVQEVFR
jgi:cysteine desulfurase / selenocysteine lyase